MGYATYQELLDRLCEIRDGEYRSDPDRDAARFASLESIMQSAERTVWYVVGDLTQPGAEPFVLMKVDTSVRRDGGVEGEVISLHWQREEAERIAHEFNSGPLN